MKKIIRYILLANIFLLCSCGISEHSTPSVLEKGDSCFQYILSAIQTNPNYQIGDEFVPTIGFKASWGIGYNTEMGVKTFGLGLGPEIKYQFIKYKDFASTVGYEFGFSFPIMGDIITSFVPINKDFLHFVSKPFYYTGLKLISGVEKDTWVLSGLFKIGYLDNIGFLPDISTAESSYPGFWYQLGLSLLSRERKSAMLGVGIEIGALYPKKLIYISFLYRF